MFVCLASVERLCKFVWIKWLQFQLPMFGLRVFLYSTGQRDCSTYTCVKCVQYGGFTRKLHVRNTQVKFYTTYYTHLNYTWIASILAKDETFCYSYMQSACFSSQRKVQMPHQTTRSPSGLSGSKQIIWGSEQLSQSAVKWKMLLLGKKNKLTSFTPLNIFHEVLLKLLRPYAEQIHWLQFETLKSGLTNFKSVRCGGVECENAKTSKSVLSQMNKPQS